MSRNGVVAALVGLRALAQAVGLGWFEWQLFRTCAQEGSGTINRE